MRVLVVGSGGREHALAWKLKQSPLVSALFIAPGNAGTAEEGTNVAIKDDDLDGLIAFAKRERVDLVVPGPELPLTLGLADLCAAEGIACFGPTSLGARLEGSKVFSKTMMHETGVPTAPYKVFTDYQAAAAHVKAVGAPLVIKADGLAAGKGVVVAGTVDEALAALDDMLEKKVFGEAGRTVVVEALAVGEEGSFMCFCDGKTVVPLASSQDHKRAFDFDQGPNTGGMGAYSPAPILPDDKLEQYADLVVRPVVKRLAEMGSPFVGVLYAGLMIDERGTPTVLEYNVRFGDPECQPLMLRLASDLAAIMTACTKGRLHPELVRFSERTAVCVVAAAKGYPGTYAKGMPITGVADADSHPGVKTFLAGVKRTDEGGIVASGGRVLGVTALAGDPALAKDLAYKQLLRIHFDGVFFRRDIADRAIDRPMPCA